MGVLDPQFDLPVVREQSPRLRLLPVYYRRDGEPSHYLVLDRLAGVPAEQVAQLTGPVDVPVLLFPFEVDLPAVDDDGEYVDGPEELIQLGQPDGAGA